MAKSHRLDSHRLPTSLQHTVDEARAAQRMEEALRGALVRVPGAVQVEARRALKEQRALKAGSYTLAEKYKLLDIFPPTVTLVDTKIV